MNCWVNRSAINSQKNTQLVHFTEQKIRGRKGNTVCGYGLKFQERETRRAQQRDDMGNRCVWKTKLGKARADTTIEFLTIFFESLLYSRIITVFRMMKAGA